MRGKWLVLGSVLIALILIILSGAAWAKIENFTLDWWTVDGGGGTSFGGGYTLSETVGQPDANVLTGGEYTLAGGFWPGGETVVSNWYINLPLVSR